MEKVFVRHPFAPVFDERSKILILGTMPSEKSRENRFYYGNPRNRFWSVLQNIFCANAAGEFLPIDPIDTIAQKKKFLLENRLAVWDVLSSCDISRSSDSSIQNAAPNNIERILRRARIQKIAANGKTAFALYKKFWGERLEEKYGIEAICLPSTSPANAAWSLQKLTAVWKAALVD